MQTRGNWIAGQWKEGRGEDFQSVNPVNNIIVWQGKGSNSQDIEEAVLKAKESFNLWSSLKVEERSKFLEAYAAALKLNEDSLAQAISHETGKPLWEAKTEVASTIAKIAISIQAQRERASEIIKSAAGSASIIRRKPLGVAAVFGPYNFPAHLPNGHIVPALLAGNTVLFKPSELTPLVGQILAQCIEDANLPEGTFQLLQGGKQTGILLSQSPELDGLFFTGSYATGKRLSEQFGSVPGKMLALEMGGNNPLVVSTITDVKAAAITTILSAFITSGQRCSCARRLILIESKTQEPYLNALISQTKDLKIGSFNEIPEPFMGPLVSKAAADKVYNAYQDLIQKGGTPIVEMQKMPGSGAFLTPGIVDVTNARQIADEEIFGPLLQLIRVKTLDEAIEKANQTQFGLTAAILSDKKSEFESFVKRINAGVINWNSATTGASSAMPFGGIGSSGNHRPSAYYAVDYCTYPIASQENDSLTMPKTLPPGIDNVG